MGRNPRRSTTAASTPSPTMSGNRRRVLLFVRERIAAGAPPTVREVQQALGFRAVESARRHLEALVADGLLAKEAGRARGYRLPLCVGVSVGGGGNADVRDGRGSAGGSAGSGGRHGHAGPVPVRLVPRLGRVQAGALQEAIEDPEGWLPVDGAAGGDAELFALTVRGESMLGAGILPGDTVVVRRQPTARDGEIVVAQVGDEATVKRLKLDAGRIVLQPENPAFAPIVIAPDTEIRILGRVVEVRRRLA